MYGIVILSLIYPLAILASSFIFWRRLEKEFTDEQLWPLIFKISIWSLLAGRIAWWLWQVPQHLGQPSWFWQMATHPGIDLFGSLIGTVLVINYHKRFPQNIVSEVGDSLIEAYLWALMITKIGQLLTHWPANWISAILIFITVIIWHIVKKYYRRWTWYPSGKVGCLWWTGIFLISLWQLVELGISFPKISIFTGLRIFYFLIPLLTSIIGLYKLSGRDKQVDIQKFIYAIKVRFVIIKQKFRNR